jgi:sulfide dehydrogenase cytochrome subunit
MRTILLGLASLGSAVALAQAPAPAAPNFAPPNLSPKGVQSMAAACSMCHGTNGRPAAGSPVAGLAARPRDEIVQSMAQFKSGAKPATIMHQIARGYSDAEVAALADYFSRQAR